MSLGLVAGLAQENEVGGGLLGPSCRRARHKTVPLFTNETKLALNHVTLPAGSGVSNPYSNSSSLWFERVAVDAV